MFASINYNYGRPFQRPWEYSCQRVCFQEAEEKVVGCREERLLLSRLLPPLQMSPPSAPQPAGVFIIDLVNVGDLQMSFFQDERIRMSPFSLTKYKGSIIKSSTLLLLFILSIYLPEKSKNWILNIQTYFIFLFTESQNYRVITLLMNIIILKE